MRRDDEKLCVYFSSPPKNDLIKQPVQSNLLLREVIVILSLQGIRIISFYRRKELFCVENFLDNDEEP